MNKSERQKVLVRVKALFAVDGLKISQEAEKIFNSWINGEITEKQRREMILEVNRAKIAQNRPEGINNMPNGSPSTN